MPVSSTFAAAAPPDFKARRIRPANIAELLLQAAQQHPCAGIHFVSGERPSDSSLLTHAALLDEARCILGSLRAYNRPRGAKVALLLEGARDFIPAFWACVLGGYIPCPLTPIRSDPERWAKHLAHVDALLDHPLLVTSTALKSELSELHAADLTQLRKGPPQESLHEAQLTDPAALVLTSGSTGNSKAVVLSHANILASLAGKTERQQLRATDTTLNWISFDHVAALLEVHLVSLYVGATQLHVGPAEILTDPTLFLRLIDRYRVTVTFSPNFLLGQINTALQSAHDSTVRPQAQPLDLSCLRHIISGGEANVVETGRCFLELLAPYGLDRAALRPAFGMTETCAGSIYSSEFPDYDANREFAAVGAPITGLQMRIVDDLGATPPPGGHGELQLKGPMIFERYHNNEAATSAAFSADGWFRTGDLGRIDAGRLSLVGRSKDSIIVSGVNYFSHELETVLEPLEGIERSFVAAFPTRPKGADTERLVVAFATCIPLAEEARLHQLAVAVRNTTILLWGFRPALILPLPKGEFPKTSLGKIQRALLRKRLEAGELAAHEAHIASVTSRQLGPYTTPEGSEERAVAGIYADVFGLDRQLLSATANFFDLGGTSLDIFKLKKKLEKHFGLADVPVVTILQNPTVRALAAHMSPQGHPGEGVYDPLVPLQISGSRTPLFCIHPGTGDVLVFVSLANYFVNDRPFYALRARGFNDAEEYFSTFAEMVDTYVAAIRKRQPHGPYALAGYSFGGPVAFEIAKVLESQGERVAFVGNIDAAPVIGWHSGKKLDYVDTTVIVAFFLSLVDKVQMEVLPDRIRATHPAQDACEYLIQNAPPERLAELNLDLPKFKAWANLAYSLVLIGQAYTPTGAVEAVTVFYAQPLAGTKEECLRNQLMRWDEFTRTPGRYIEVAGEHHTLLGPKHVASFQAVMRAELHRALGGK